MHPCLTGVGPITGKLTCQMMELVSGQAEVRTPDAQLRSSCVLHLGFSSIPLAVSVYFPENLL